MAFKVNDRVEIPAHTDEWMRGDRYGTVEMVDSHQNHLVMVLMDKSGRSRAFVPNELKGI